MIAVDQNNEDNTVSFELLRDYFDKTFSAMQNKIDVDAKQMAKILKSKPEIPEPNLKEKLKDKFVFNTCVDNSENNVYYSCCKKEQNLMYIKNVENVCVSAS